MRRTKIIATLGPSSKNPEQLVSLINAGMDVARFNFSHGNHAFYREFFALLRQVSQEMNRPISILQDLQGPKIRTGALKDNQPIELVAGQELRISTQDTIGTVEEISTSYSMLPHDVQVGDRILLSDGTIELRVKNIISDVVITDVVHGGSLRENQGINLPGIRTSIPAVTEKDIEDLKFGLEQGVDYVAVSFVRQASDITEVKKLIADAGKDTPVIAKLEKPEALDNLQAILAVVDAVMVARGDLGVEMPLEQVPMAQKHIIHTANHAGVPVITATQMLDSMIHNPRPTRAEASDVANAILDGTDVVMLSGETANGSFPVESVRTMAQIAEAVEGQRESHAREHHVRVVPEIQTVSSQANAIGSAAYALVESLPVRAIATFTQTGRTARIMAQQRPDVPIIALTPNKPVYQRLNLLWGVTPILTDVVHDIETLETHVQTIVKDHDLAEAGENVVITGGHPTTAFGETNFLKIIEIK